VAAITKTMESVKQPDLVVYLSDLMVQEKNPATGPGFFCRAV